MELSRRLGNQISQWVKDDPELAINTQRLANLLKDLLEPEANTLRGPLTDIVNQPLFHQSLSLTGSRRNLAVNELQKYIKTTYSASVSLQLEYFLESASGISLRKNIDHTEDANKKNDSKELLQQSSQLIGEHLKQFGFSTLRSLHTFSAGIGLSFAFAMVFTWLGGEIDRLGISELGIGGSLLISFLSLIELSRVKSLRLNNIFSRWMINSLEINRREKAWKWIGNPYVHAKTKEGVLNILILIIILGRTNLPLSEVLLRFNLTSLACLIGAASCARNFGIAKVWGGASGSVAALISLASCLSLFENRTLMFDIGWTSFPAWVLLVINSSLQLTWQLEQRGQNSGKEFVHRILSSTFAWGTILGSLWAVITILQRSS